MRTTVTAWIAARYLISKKSHSAVGAISLVSLCGVAVATAAIICVLSVFNGFKSVIADRLDMLAPDIRISPLKGKVFPMADSLATEISRLPAVRQAVPALPDNALAVCDSREMPVTLKGVSLEAFRSSTSLDSLILDKADIPAGSNPAIFSLGAANRLMAPPGKEVLVFAPVREGRVNLANPAASFVTDSLAVASVFRSNQSEYDENVLFADIDLVRNLLQYDSEASSIEIALNPGSDIDKAVSEISGRLGPSFVVRDRQRLQSMSFRMVTIEKWVTFLLLFFILIIASFNVISSLSMLVLDKLKAISTLRAIGFSRSRVGRVFFWESIYVTAAGGLAGIILGVALSLAQQHFGFIKLQGDPEALTLNAYPVVVDPTDILITLLPLAVIGLATALVTAAFARSRVQH